MAYWCRREAQPLMYTLSPIGAFAKEVKGLSLWEMEDELTIARLDDVWSRHGVLVFRRQVLSEAELVDFSRSFGDPEVIVRDDWSSNHTPEVIQISNMKNYHGQPIGGLGVGELDWHTDQSYMIEPATGSILYMVEMPPQAPLTYWANLQLAYAALPEHKKEEINDLQVIYDYSVRQSTYDDEPKMPAEIRHKTPPVTHPLVNRHPQTGYPSLYLDPTTAAGIKGWHNTQSKTLLDELVTHVTQTNFIYTHDWQIGDVVMWDNGFLMHRRDAFDAAHNRLLKRTTLKLSPDRHLVPTGNPVT